MNASDFTSSELRANFHVTSSRVTQNSFKVGFRRDLERYRAIFV